MLVSNVNPSGIIPFTAATVPTTDVAIESPFPKCCFANNIIPRGIIIIPTIFNIAFNEFLS